MSAEVRSVADDVQFTRTVCARIPTIEGEFQLCHFANTRDNKEHLALVLGDVAGGESVPVRVHSECFTGDVLGSRRCDCGDQLHYAMAYIAEAGRGVVIYLRQEGRGIGLEHKLQAYNLQDEGYDTVEANILLGHQADEREYWAAAAILEDLQIRSIQLLTNNPAKIEHLRVLGVRVEERLPVIVDVNDDNRAYLETKALRMRHMLKQAETTAHSAVAARDNGNEPQPHAMPGALSARLDGLKEQIGAHNAGRPFVTLTYAQSLNGAIGGAGGAPVRISGPESMRVTHELRATHDAILVGIGTLLADDPSLTLRLAEGSQPQPVVLDTHLRTPLGARLLMQTIPPLIATLEANEQSPQARALQDAGATLLYLPAGSDGRVSLPALLAALRAQGVNSLMVEGGAQVITAFLQEKLVDALVVTIAPRLLTGIGGLAPAESGKMSFAMPQMADAAWTPAGEDLILWATPEWVV